MPPVLTALVPSSGPPGTLFKIYGTGFANPDGSFTGLVLGGDFGANPLIFGFWSASTLQTWANVAPGTTGSFAVTVRVDGSGNSNALTFTITNQSAFTPPSPTTDVPPGQVLFPSAYTGGPIRSWAWPDDYELNAYVVPMPSVPGGSVDAQALTRNQTFAATAPFLAFAVTKIYFYRWIPTTVRNPYDVVGLNLLAIYTVPDLTNDFIPLGGLYANEVSGSYYALRYHVAAGMEVNDLLYIEKFNDDGSHSSTTLIASGIGGSEPYLNGDGSKIGLAVSDDESTYYLAPQGDEPSDPGSAVYSATFVGSPSALVSFPGGVNAAYPAYLGILHGSTTSDFVVVTYDNAGPIKLTRYASDGGIVNTALTIGDLNSEFVTGVQGDPWSPDVAWVGVSDGSTQTIRAYSMASFAGGPLFGDILVYLTVDQESPFAVLTPAADYLDSPNPPTYGWPWPSPPMLALLPDAYDVIGAPLSGALVVAPGPPTQIPLGGGSGPSAGYHITGAALGAVWSVPTETMLSFDVTGGSYALTGAAINSLPDVGDLTGGTGNNGYVLTGAVVEGNLILEGGGTAAELSSGSGLSAYHLSGAALSGAIVVTSGTLSLAIPSGLYALTGPMMIPLPTPAPGESILQVSKVTDPAGSPVQFTIEGPGLTPAVFTLGDGDSLIFTGLTPGAVYSLFESPDIAWTTDVIVSTGDPVNAVVLRINQSTFVTFTNTAFTVCLGDPPVTPPQERTFRRIRRMRRGPHIGQEQQWIFHQKIQIDLEVGVAPITGPGDFPTILLQWSDDGGHTWCPGVRLSVGSFQQFRYRAMARRLGRSRDRIYQVTMDDPIPWRLVGAYLDAAPGTT